MEKLPFIDAHQIRIAAPVQDVWQALLRTMRGQFSAALPRPVSKLWGLQETQRRGDWNQTVALGDTILGFAVAECAQDRRLTLQGRHRFSRYELRFDMAPTASGEVEVIASTWAIFPGFLGAIYRALVIGTGGHKLAVRHVLLAVARRAQR